VNQPRMRSMKSRGVRVDDAQHGVRPAWITGELHFAARLLQRHEHLLPLPDGTAIVGFACTITCVVAR